MTDMETFSKEELEAALNRLEVLADRLDQVDDTVQAAAYVQLLRKLTKCD